MYYCRWCAVQSGWPTVYAFIHKGECCLCGSYKNCANVSYKRIYKEAKKNIDIPLEDVVKLFSNIFK